MSAKSKEKPIVYTTLGNLVNHIGLDISTFGIVISFSGKKDIRSGTHKYSVSYGLIDPTNPNQLNQYRLLSSLTI